MSHCFGYCVVIVLICGSVVIAVVIVWSSLCSHSVVTVMLIFHGLLFGFIVSAAFCVLDLNSRILSYSTHIFIYGATCSEN